MFKDGPKPKEIETNGYKEGFSKSIVASLKGINDKKTKDSAKESKAGDVLSILGFGEKKKELGLGKKKAAKEEFDLVAKPGKKKGS